MMRRAGILAAALVLMPALGPCAFAADGAAAPAASPPAFSSSSSQPGSTLALQPGTIPKTGAMPAIPPVSNTQLENGMAIPPPPSANALAGTSTNPNEARLLAQQAEEAAMEAEAEHQAEEEKHNRESYSRATNGLLPLSPGQIHGFMRRLEQSQQAAVPPSSGPPKGKVKLVTLSLSPGVNAPEIDLAAGYVTTITLVDATGAPWPILDAAVGGNFEVSPTAASTHVVRVMPLTRFAEGDLSLVLKQLSTPIIFRLKAGGPEVDLRYDARVPALGPNAKVPLISRPRLEAGDQNIVMILDDTPPAGAKRLKVNGVDPRTKAWELGDHVYVRTPLTLLSPAWNASVAAMDGTTVYEIGEAPVLLMSENGAMVRARIEREDENDQQP
ncbi:MAG TPA: DotH/IcmK family type IV secretion protein [Alphaproteobacteria bacterium]|nr:DotH/IcmK family type IV secretion protein [Alphaproteobacteria bacterium]